MNEKFNKNTKVEQLTKVVLSHWEEKGLIVKDPYRIDLHSIIYIYTTKGTSSPILRRSEGGRVKLRDMKI